MERNVHIGNKW
jgi:hypothetical protein